MFGKELTMAWRSRTSFDVPPPPLDDTDFRHPQYQDIFQDIPSYLLPKSESLKDTVDRVVPYWHETICPMVQNNKQVLVVAHGNTLRALHKYLSGMSEQEILGYKVPHCVPMVYEFDQDMMPHNYYYLHE